MFDFLIRLIVLIVAWLGLTGALGGCTAGIDPLQTTIHKVVDEVVIPNIQKALAETGARSGQMQFAAQGINPGYHFKASGKWVIGVEIDGVVYVDGVAGQVTYATQSDTGADQPHAPEPAAP